MVDIPQPATLPPPIEEIITIIDIGIPQSDFHPGDHTSTHAFAGHEVPIRQHEPSLWNEEGVDLTSQRQTKGLVWYVMQHGEGEHKVKWAGGGFSQCSQLIELCDIDLVEGVIW